VNPHGVIAKMLLGEIIMSNKLRITDEKGQLKIDGNLEQILDNLNRVRVKLGEYETGHWGLQVFDKSGESVVFDEQGILQTNIIPVGFDNLNSSNPIIVPFKLGNKVVSIKQASLRFKLENFRSYDSTVVGGSSSISTTVSGGGISQSFTSSTEELYLNNLSNTYTHGIIYNGVPGDTATHEHNMGQQLVA
jgi:hypothetical protein